MPHCKRPARRPKTMNLVAAALRLKSYLSARAKHEGVEMQLSDAFFYSGLKVGGRLFFGIIVDDAGRLAEDTQEPEPGFLARWKLQRRAALMQV